MESSFRDAVAQGLQAETRHGKISLPAAAALLVGVFGNLREACAHHCKRRESENNATHTLLRMGKQVKHFNSIALWVMGNLWRNEPSRYPQPRIEERVPQPLFLFTETNSVGSEQAALASCSPSPQVSSRSALSMRLRPADSYSTNQKRPRFEFFPQLNSATSCVVF